MQTRPSETSAASVAWVALGAVALGGVVGAALFTRQPLAKPHPDSAPDRTARQARLGRMATVGRTVTIHSPRHAVYDAWRDTANLPRLMEDLDRVTDMGDGTFRWVLSGPAGLTVHVDTRIVTDRPGKEIAWISVEGSQVRTEGRILFREAPGDRGTEVEATITWKPILGEIGRVVTLLARRDPATQARRALKRLKMLLETGEIATARNRRDPKEE